jgi:hypothetical protein
MTPPPLYALVDARLPAEAPRGQVVMFYASRAAAERRLRNVLRDEPSCAPYMRVFEFPLVELPVAQLSLN